MNMDIECTIKILVGKNIHFTYDQNFVSGIGAFILHKGQ